MSLAFPNVPALPGVPVVAQAISAFNNVLAVPQILLNADALYNLSTLFVPKWGIFDEFGAPLLVGDSVIGFNFGADNKVSDYPIEDGQFASYNKTALPYEGKMTFAIDGSVAERTAFLQAVSDLAASLQLVNIVTPEITYVQANIVKPQYDRTRQSGGTSMVFVDVFYRQIRITEPSTFSNTELPDSQDSQAGGTVQPETETPPPNPNTPITREDLPPPNTTPGTSTPSNGVTGGASTTSGSTAGSTIGSSIGSLPASGSDPQIPNVPAANISTQTITQADGSRMEITTYRGVAANDPAINTPTSSLDNAYKQADGTYTMEHYGPPILPGQGHPTIPGSSPNAGVAS